MSTREMPTWSPRPGAISDEAQRAWFAILATHATVTRSIDADLALKHDTSFNEFEVLCRLRQHQPQSVRMLAGSLVSASASWASRLVQHLVDSGYLRRDADQRDGRVSMLSVTPAGRKYTEAVNVTFDRAVQRYFLDALDDEDLAALTRIWAKLAELNSDEQASAPDGP